MQIWNVLMRQAASPPHFLTLHLWLSCPQGRLQLSQACGVGWCPLGLVRLFPRAVLDGLEHAVCFLILLRPNIWQPTQLACGILGLGRAVYKDLDLKKPQSPEWNSSSRRPVLRIQMHFFEISLAEGKKNKVLNLRIGF